MHPSHLDHRLSDGAYHVITRRVTKNRSRKFLAAVSQVEFFYFSSDKQYSAFRFFNIEVMLYPTYICRQFHCFVTLARYSNNKKNLILQYFIKYQSSVTERGTNQHFSLIPVKVIHISVLSRQLFYVSYD